MRSLTPFGYCRPIYEVPHSVLSVPQLGLIVIMILSLQYHTPIVPIVRGVSLYDYFTTPAGVRSRAIAQTPAPAWSIDVPVCFLATAANIKVPAKVSRVYNWVANTI